MMAAVKTFTQYYNLNKYISICSSLIQKAINIEVPNCMIRNDFNHVMHLLSSWIEYKSVSRRVKNFYLRAIGLIIVNFEDIKILLKLIFTVKTIVTVNSIIGSINLIGAKMYPEKKEIEDVKINTNDLSTSKIFEETESIHEDEKSDGSQTETEFENWMGLGLDKYERNNKKSNNLDKDLNILYYNENSKTKSPIIGLLKNGNSSHLKSITIEKNCYLFTNTCAFDSVTQVMMTAFADSIVYADFITTNKIYVFFEMISNTLRD